ncbi:Trehalose utilization [Rubripirellula lacrimiformis]|uniref:Trehalose utilization n=1 Tax=Rubripirellula lacrimiformis TaxID=1930273 RepID=A0A517NAW5_9BACT|nr:ThuA domain-containing protein [Rubripirellula lacrimiformis]QDT04270.1 Trehalose utilization [Rubripirellula lacrimiformis]
MSASIRTLFAAALVLVATGLVDAQDEKSPAQTAAKPIRALMVTGGCCHDYENQKQLISEGLSASIGDIEWTICDYDDKRETKAAIYEEDDWISRFDIVIHNECYGAVEDGDFVQSIVDAHVRSGVPAMVIHCSMHSYRAAPTANSWRGLLGVTSRRHEKVKRSLKVVPTAEGKSDPITAALGDGWSTPNGELYIIENVWPNTNVLATAHSDETGNDEPVVWTNEYQGVRLFGTTLGHHNETIQTEQWQSMVAGGWRWVLEK